MSYYNNEPVYTGDVQPPPAPHYGTTDLKIASHGGRSTRNLFAAGGVLLLVMLCVVPIWNAVSLMEDANYVFWAGRAEPAWLIGSCLLVIIVYVLTILLFFNHSRPQAQTEQSVMMIANIFITLLGLMLMLGALPLSWQSVETSNNIMHRCDFSDQTHRLYEYSQVLHNIRREPACAKEKSVEQCDGYQESLPYTAYLKSIETQFRCSGFCYRPPPAATANATATASLLQQAAGKKSAGTVEKHVPSVLSGVAARMASAPQYPPTLFTDANFQASCDGMAARDMKNYAGDIGFQTFYQGIYLVLIAIITGFLKLVGFCVRRDRDTLYVDPSKPQYSTRA